MQITTIDELLQQLKETFQFKNNEHESIIDIYDIPRWIYEEEFHEHKHDLYDVASSFTRSVPYFYNHTKESDFFVDVESYFALYKLELDEKNFYLGVTWYFYILEYFYPYSIPYCTTQIIKRIIKNYPDKIKNEIDHFNFWRETQHLLLDGHCITTYNGSIYDEKYVLPFEMMAVDDVIIISKVKESYAQIIPLGSEIIKIDGKGIRELIDSVLIFSKGSNHDFILSDTLMRIANSQRNRESLITLGNGATHTIKNYDRFYNEPDIRKTLGKNTGFLSEGIFYINGDRLDMYSGETISDEIKSGKVRGLILDHRGYEISNYDLQTYIQSSLFKDQEYFAMVRSNEILIPCAKYVYNSKAWQDKENLFPEADLDIKIVILVDSSTLSRSEWVTMQYQRIQRDGSSKRNVLVVGQQTAGADGNVRNFYLPGRITVMMTFMGVFYLNSVPTQRKGIIIDKFVKYKPDDEDQILNEGIHHLNLKN